MTLQGLIGNLSVLFGSFLYSFVRNREMDAAKKRAKANDTDLEKDDISEDRPLLKNANKVEFVFLMFILLTLCFYRSFLFLCVSF